MPLEPTWQDIALRLFLTMLAGAIVGFNRGLHGHAAGFRTTILIGLAASVAMIQANILLSLGGKAADSFGVMDLMRLPLGILTGVGFIGAGAILRRDNLVTGVTTAATLWIMTVIGLCFGGGQLGLGIAATLLTVMTLWGLRWIDERMPRKHKAMLVVATKFQPSSVGDFASLVSPAGYKVRFHRQAQADDPQYTKLWFEIIWNQPEVKGPPLDLLALLNAHYTVVSFELMGE